MRTLEISDGDLVLEAGSYRTVAGAAKVAQDLRMALIEPVGNDRFHPRYGSTLDSYIGLVLDEATRFVVEQEVNRVVSNYVAVQRDKVERDALAGGRSRYTTADVVAEVEGVAVEASLDKVLVTIRVRTLDRQRVVLSTSVGG